MLLNSLTLVKWPWGDRELPETTEKVKIPSGKKPDPLCKKQIGSKFTAFSFLKRSKIKNIVPKNV